MRHVLSLVSLVLVVALSVVQTSAQQAEPSRTERILYGVSIGGVAVTTLRDHESTELGLATGQFEERNLLLRTERGGYNGTLKFAISGATLASNHFLLWRRGRHRWAIAANLLLAATQGVAAYNNQRQIRLLALPPSPEPRPARPLVRVGFQF
jgi:hypothetical protein